MLGIISTDKIMLNDEGDNIRKGCKNDLGIQLLLPEKLTKSVGKGTDLFLILFYKLEQVFGFHDYPNPFYKSWTSVYFKHPLT